VFQARDYFVVVEAGTATEPVTEIVASTVHEAELSPDDISDVEDDVAEYREDDIENLAILEETVESATQEALANVSNSLWQASNDEPTSLISSVPVLDELEVRASPDAESLPGKDEVLLFADASLHSKNASAPAASWYDAMAESAPVDSNTEDSMFLGDETDLAKLYLARLDLAQEDPQDIVGEISAPRQKSWPWMLVGLVLIALLGGQYAWYAKDVLAQDATVRPYYKLACGYLGCGLPLYLNRRAIETTDLVVRSQQNNPPALIVDAIIKNSGAFRQVFPDLELQFTNADNRLIASRRFSPAEYLAGEMIGLGYFPAFTEVRLSLEIVDPGADALGYSLAIAPDS
jgi:hypothetical protein